jgi:hypothetical protein
MLGPQPKINGKILSFTGPGIVDGKSYFPLVSGTE